MARHKTTLYIDDDVRAATKVAAVAAKKTESEIVEEALRQYLKTDDAERHRQSIRDLFDRIAEYQAAQGVPPLTDDEAMQLANEELHAMRAERRRREQAKKAG
jgi:Arc/MetJ family transcription regulator